MSEERPLPESLKSPRQRLAKFLHVSKTLLRREKAREVERFKVFIPQESVIFDIGAHFGQYAKAFARLHCGSCQVFCFEPVDYTRDVLRAVIGRRGNVRVFSNGFAERPGNTVIRIPLKASGEIGPGLAHLGEETVRDFVSQAIELDTIDRFADRHDLQRLDFIKIDIEGAELSALMGGQEVIDGFKPSVLCEVNAEYMRRMGAEPDALFRFFAQLGYQAFHAEAMEAPELTFYQGAKDYLFVHPARG